MPGRVTRSSPGAGLLAAEVDGAAMVVDDAEIAASKTRKARRSLRSAEQPDEDASGAAMHNEHSTETSPGVPSPDNCLQLEGTPVRKRASSVTEVEGRREMQTLKQRRLEARITLAHTSEARQTVVFGRYTIVAWYPSAYPDPYRQSDVLYICPFTLKFFTDEFALKRHRSRCKWRHPPGREVYRKDDLSFFELAGSRETEYCQNLCLMSKLFLKHKVAFFHMRNFLFYVMVRWHSDGGHILGYFSKEVDSPTDYNLSCILTLPQHQRQGYGGLLIDFSYLLTRAEGKTGTPERPLSDLGLLSYRAYWKNVIFSKLQQLGQLGELSIRDLSIQTGLKQYDIVTTLQSLGMVKYWRGKHFVVTTPEFDHWVSERADKTEGNARSLILDPSALEKKLLLGYQSKPLAEQSIRGHLKKSPASRV